MGQAPVMAVLTVGFVLFRLALPILPKGLEGKAYSQYLVPKSFRETLFNRFAAVWLCVPALWVSCA